ncbi:MAG: Integral membrane protein [Virgibacillus proomii]
MKKIIIFSISFILLFLLFQVSAGLLLTLIYAPDITETWNINANLSQTVVLKSSSFLIPLLFTLLSALIAYFISKKFV